METIFADEDLKIHRLCKYCVIRTFDEMRTNPDTFWGTPHIKVTITQARCHRRLNDGRFPYINPENLGCGDFEPRKKELELVNGDGTK